MQYCPWVGGRGAGGGLGNRGVGWGGGMVSGERLYGALATPLGLCNQPCNLVTLACCYAKHIRQWSATPILPRYVSLLL